MADNKDSGSIATENIASTEADSDKIELVLDIPVAVTVEIGRTKMTIRNLLQLNQGGIVALDRLASEPLDVLVNGTLVAHGEVVVVNDKFGVRLTDIVSKAERIKRLR
ncbi:flagellar motor switch protein FliN [Legionella dresdenensis]|uniref:Flagellar motor switch protein FliN n=1 Tax=Legionella dresdenensis TaxID=450200 RepID=A0ABV8CCF0_9GAMM